MKKSKYEYSVPEHQADAVLTQAAPVQNTWYTILDTTRNCRLIACWCMVEDTGENLAMRITIDGNVYTAAAIAANPGDWYDCFLRGYDGILNMRIYGAPPLEAYRAFLLEGRSIKVECRKSTAAGAGTLNGRVTYATW